MVLHLLMRLSADAKPSQNTVKSAKKPIMALESSFIDLGSVLEGETLTARFSVKNEGSEKLVIDRVKTGCKCTRADYTTNVPAGGTATIELKIDTLGMHGRRVFKTAVYSNDPEHSAVTLRVRADITPLVTLTPDRFFLKGGPGKNLKQEIIINTHGRRPLDVRMEGHDLQDRVKVSLKPVIKNRQYCLTLENLVKEAESFRGRIILNTNYPGRKKIAVPVFVYTRAPIGLYPENLALAPGRCPSCRDKLFGELLIKAQDDQPLQIVSVEMPSSECTCEINTLVKSQAYNIQVECICEKDCSGKSVLVIHTNRKDFKQIEVPVVYP